MKKTHLLNVFMLCCAFCISSFASANTEDKLESDSVSMVNDITQSSNDGNLSDRVDKLDKIISYLPKISGYVQTGYNWGDKNGDNRSSFQMKRMRLFVDKKISNVFDFRAQFEVFSGSTDGTPHQKKVMTIMDAFVNVHVNKNIHFRAGQYYLPLGFENYDISPATLEAVDFSTMLYRMVTRNAVSSPNLIDYGRDIGVMMYGDLLENKDQSFNYLSYNLSVTNGNLPTLNDDNRSKDIVGRLTVRPIDKLRIIGSYNWGEYKGLNEHMEVKNYLTMNRALVGAWYFDPNGLSLRAEYGHIESKKANIKEDGGYVLAAYKVDKFLPSVRWDMYRDQKNKISANNKDALLLGCAYEPLKDIKVQLNYVHTMYTSKVKDAGTKSGNGNSIQLMLLAKF